MEYNCVTTVTDGFLSRLSGTKSGMDANQSYRNQANDIYYIYVKRADYQRAKQIAFQS